MGTTFSLETIFNFPPLPNNRSNSGSSKFTAKICVAVLPCLSFISMLTFNSSNEYFKNSDLIVNAPEELKMF